MSEQGPDKCEHRWQLRAGEVYVCDDCNTWWPDWANNRITELQQEVERLQYKIAEFIGGENEGPHPDTARLNRLV